MDIFGIGPLELLLIFLVILLVMGPREMSKASRTIGSFLRKMVTSEGWMAFKKLAGDVRELPYEMMRQSGMEEDIEALREVRDATQAISLPKITLPDVARPSLSTGKESVDPAYPGWAASGATEPPVSPPPAPAQNDDPAWTEHSILPPDAEQEGDPAPSPAEDHPTS